jgi:tetratricopeptide (TPR) repeat protein
VLWLALAALPAWPQSLSDAERADLLKQQAQLFQQMLQKPSDLDLAFKYADVSARLGDNEAAVTALERMLLFNPNLPRVQLELGALYFRMGSFQISREYFNKAAAAKPPADVQSKIDEYLAQIQKLSGGSQFSGFAFMGVQRQSDANVAPGSPTLISPLSPIALSLSNDFVKQPDVNIFATTSMLYSYDLETQNHDTVDVTGTAFGNHYFKFGRLDLALGEVTAGPRFNFTDPGLGVQTVTARPYALLNEVGLGGNQYFYTWGVGGELGATLPDNLTLTGKFELREKHFSNATDRPSSIELSGNDKLLSLLGIKGVTDNSALTLEFDYLDQSTADRTFSNYSYAGSGNYRIRYEDPTGLLKYPWETTFSLARTWSLYQAPSAFFGTTRDDRRWRIGLTQNFQVLDNLTLTVQLQRDIVSSNQPLFAYTSNSFLVGPQIRF